MTERIKCPYCNKEFEVVLPDEQIENIYYEGKVRCENCNNMVTVFTKPHIVIKPID